VPLCGQFRIEQDPEQMVKYMCHLTGSSVQLLQDGEVIENRRYGSDHYMYRETNGRRV
jgi:hypothetical protein